MTTNYEDLLRDFESRDLDAASFRHVDHVGVAYEMLRKYDFIEAVARYSRDLDAIATKAGAAKKFNATMTFAFMSLIAERMETGTYADYTNFIAENADLKSKNVLDRFYSPERLQTDLARHVFLMPDRV